MQRITDLRAPAPALPPTLPLLFGPEPNDPLYLDTTRQWGLHTGLWSIGLAGYPRPPIAVLDTGVDANHEEWRGTDMFIFPRSTFQQNDLVDDWSFDGHGTHVTGILAAPANGVGLVGVAPASGPGVAPGGKVIPVQIADRDGYSQDPTIMRGIRWAVNHGAKVINISSSGPDYNQAFQDTINWAYRRGVLIVASVGNDGDGSNPFNYPAGYDHVIGVAAQCNGVVAPPDCPVAFGTTRWSNHNASVDLSAPGVDIASTQPIRVTDAQISPGYGRKDGTSMATPFVSGAAAHIYASHPGISPFQVTRILYATASRGVAGLPRTSVDGWGVVNPVAAAQAAAPPDDLGEPNDDIRDLGRRQTLVLSRRTPLTLRPAWGDPNDDASDVYPVALRAGDRVRVTITSPGTRLRAQVFRPTGYSISPRLVKRGPLTALALGRAVETPGTRSIVVRATTSGRHFVSVQALRGGGYYNLTLTRL